MFISGPASWNTLSTTDTQPMTTVSMLRCATKLYMPDKGQRGSVQRVAFVAGEADIIPANRAAKPKPDTYALGDCESEMIEGTFEDMPSLTWLRGKAPPNLRTNEPWLATGTSWEALASTVR